AHMAVRVDHARHNNIAVTVDHLSAFNHRRRPIAQLCDCVAIHSHPALLINRESIVHGDDKRIGEKRSHLPVLLGGTKFEFIVITAGTSATMTVCCMIECCPTLFPSSSPGLSR